MARTFEEIKEDIIREKESSSTLRELTSTSKASIWNEWANNITYSHLVMDQQFDQHRAEISSMIANQKKGSALWYRNMALAFQYGFRLIPETDIFDNENYTADDIEKSKIVKYSAVTEATTESRLNIKIATEKDGILQPITKEQQSAFTAYMEEIKYAGVQITVTNYRPDILHLSMLIYTDPLVIDTNGTKITDGKKVVEDTIKTYLRELPFNGELVLAHLVDRLQTIEGVNIPHIVSAESSWLDGSTGGYGNLEPITVRKIPISGYFTIDNFNDIKYVV